MNTHLATMLCVVAHTGTLSVQVAVPTQSVGTRSVQNVSDPSCPLLALDTDNGSEFLNGALFDYCDGKPIIFTRSRPYKKNDQCYVAQKNGAIVRRFVGYDRFEGVAACRVLSALYYHLRLYINFFQPSLKLIAKKRVGSRVVKKYDRAQTPLVLS